jgi:hypothetical protein
MPSPIPSSRPVPEPEDLVLGQHRSGLSTYILKPDVNCIVKKPSWSGKDTVIRPYPCVHHQNPQEFWPYRIDPGGRNYFGYWIRHFYCAWSVGSPPVTFLIQKTNNQRFNPAQTPLGILYSSIYKACQQGQARPEWYPLINGDASKLKSLRPVAECALIQGALMQYDSVDTFSQNEPPLGFGSKPSVILLLSGGLVKTLKDMLDEENPNYRGAPDDFEARYVYGDPVGLENGRYFHIFERGYGPDRRHGSGSATPFSHSGSSQKNYGNQQLRGFDVRIIKEFSGIPANSLKDYADVVREKWCHWEDVLYFPNYVEQAHILANCFPASAILYAFAGYPDWIPDDVKRRAVNAVSAAVPPIGVDSGVGPTSGFSRQPGVVFGSNPWQGISSANPGVMNHGGVPPEAPGGTSLPNLPVSSPSIDEVVPGANPMFSDTDPF